MITAICCLIMNKKDDWKPHTPTILVFLDVAVFFVMILTAVVIDISIAIKAIQWTFN